MPGVLKLFVQGPHYKISRDFQGPWTRLFHFVSVLGSPLGTLSLSGFWTVLRTLSTPGLCDKWENEALLTSVFIATTNGEYPSSWPIGNLCNGTSYPTRGKTHHTHVHSTFKNSGLKWNHRWAIKNQAYSVSAAIAPFLPLLRHVYQQRLLFILDFFVVRFSTIDYIRRW